ncbi:putative tRNA binding domain [Dillenia turbinata]|uniref:RNA cytidine acetyltransferase n=1 Tax=Dillenia turbinata TaxID=194707 RepID=A0AAN8V3C5_9MAGN
MRKKVDERIRTLIENGVKTRHRSLFVIIGDKSRDQIVNLHYMLSKGMIKSRPTVLWCYKDKLELSSHKKKRAKQIKRDMQRGLLDPEKVDQFSLFVESGGLTYCLYKDSERILGNTFGMCILQDFEALTPNLLARTIETVRGGGLVVLLLRALRSLTSLYTMVMSAGKKKKELVGWKRLYFSGVGRAKLMQAHCMISQFTSCPHIFQVRLTLRRYLNEILGVSVPKGDTVWLGMMSGGEKPILEVVGDKSCCIAIEPCLRSFYGNLGRWRLSLDVVIVARNGASILFGRMIGPSPIMWFFGCRPYSDVHERFRTESHSEAAGRFNERFLLSLASCKSCVVMDDELNILPISSHIRSINPVTVREGPEGLSEAERDLKNLKEQLNDDFPVGPLIRKCCTLDQGKAVITFLDAILDKTLRSTVACLAARGRGKSAALGLAVAGAIAAGYSNIYVTAPSPENLKTLFEFVCKGFDSLEYKEHIDYDVVKSANPEFKKATIRINIYKQHRQTIQYIQPNEHEKLSQVELLVVDEAAAIPLPVVKSLLGPYLVFLSSTVNGYEGTGRSLSLKLLQQLEEQSHKSANNVEGSYSGRLFKKIELTESIRYASGDPIESWLHSLLCLDATNSVPALSRLPLARDCDLYYVNRATLFSYHKESELFLQRMMALYVASHYKNSPNDLQLMADAPAHHLFVLLGPVDESKNQLPDILCVVQVCLEGQISHKSAMKSLSEGHQPSGDQIPWKFSEQFQDTVFPSLSGVRIVRIATHPSAMRSGYGSMAVELLTRYFEGQLTAISEIEETTVEAPPVKITEVAEKVSLLEENISPRANLPPLLVNLRERQPEKLHYMGVSFGLTLDLFRFWNKHKFLPFYIGQIPSTVTGEHTCMVLKPLNNDDVEVSESDEWGFFSPFYQGYCILELSLGIKIFINMHFDCSDNLYPISPDFRKRFSRLLASSFRQMEYKLAMSILDAKKSLSNANSTSPSSNGYLTDILSPYDMKRLESYTNNLADFHMILDLVPDIAQQYFQERIPVTLSPAQASVLLCIGLQHHKISYIEGSMKLERQQILSLFIKVMKKFHKYFEGLASKEMDSTLPSRLKEIVMEPYNVSLDEDLNNAAREVEDGMKAKTEGMLNPEFLQQYAIVDRGADIENALRSGTGKISSSGIVSVKSIRTNLEKYRKHKDESGKKRNKDNQSSKSNKRKKF